MQHAYNKHRYNRFTDIIKQFLMYELFTHLFHYNHLNMLHVYNKFMVITNIWPTQNHPVHLFTLSMCKLIIEFILFDHQFNHNK